MDFTTKEIHIQRDVAGLLEKYTQYLLFNDMGEPIKILTPDGKVFQIDVTEVEG
jgi:hypothetical protein